MFSQASKVRIERLVMSRKGPWERVLPAFLCARERDVWVRGRCLTVVFGFLFVSDYIIRLSTRLLTWNTCMNLKSIYWAYIINAGTDYLKSEFAPNLLRGIKFKSAFLHWILLCNFSDQRLNENLSNVRWIIFLVWRPLYRMSRDWN